MDDLNPYAAIKYRKAQIDRQLAALENPLAPGQTIETPGMSQAQFSGYGPARPNNQQRLAELLKARLQAGAQ